MFSNIPRLLLINPWIYDFTAFDLWSKPLGLLYIASYLRQIGYEIDYIDCLDKNFPGFSGPEYKYEPKIKKYGVGPFYRQKVKKDSVFEFFPRRYSRYGVPENLLLSRLKQCNKPDAILITSFMTYWYQGPQKIVMLLREIFPDVPIILGGIYATLMPQHAKEVVQPDYIIEGPGEIQISELLQQILKNAPRDINKPKTLDDFPYPAFDLYKNLNYLPIMSSRGCPYKCTFCAAGKISGKYVQRKPENVVSEIIHFSKKFGIKDVAFYDDALLLNKLTRLIPILKLLLKENVFLRFHTPNGLHVREIDEDLARFLFLSGFKTIRLSFESVNPNRQIEMKNKVTPEDLEFAVQNLIRAGYQRKALETYVMMGLPNQLFEEVYESILYVNSLGIKIRLASFSPIPGTLAYKRSIEDGLFPENADPLLTNKSIYPLHRTREAYLKFHSIRQFVNVLNEGVNRGINLFQSNELIKAFRKMLKNTKLE